jgi:tetratricopeptide (TPR) repeat protein
MLEHERENEGMEASVIQLEKIDLLKIIITGAIIVLLSLGTQFRNKVWTDKIVLYTDCVIKSPKKSRPFGNLGNAYWNIGENEKALHISRKAIELDPRNAHAYHTLSLIYRSTGDLGQAIKMSRKALEVDPVFFIAHYTLGEVYFENHQYAESADWLNRFLEIDPYFPGAHYFLGTVYVALKEYDKAIDEFEWELRINPSHPTVHLNLGQIYWDRFKNRGKAIQHFKAALTANPLLPNQMEIRNQISLLEGMP